MTSLTDLALDIKRFNTLTAYNQIMEEIPTHTLPILIYGRD